jgi:hypothetical protein
LLGEIAVNLALLVILLVVYLWPQREGRLERLFIATLGALVGSLVGRILVNPYSIGHLAFVTGGAVFFATFDWLRRSPRSTSH